MVHFPVCQVSLPEGKTVITYLLVVGDDQPMGNGYLWLELLSPPIWIGSFPPNEAVSEFSSPPDHGWSPGHPSPMGARCVVCSKKTTAPLREAWLSWMVVSTYPSAKYGSQLGWWNSQYMGNACSKPPTRDGFWTEKASLLEKNHEKPMNHGRKNVQLYSSWPVQGHGMGWEKSVTRVTRGHENRLSAPPEPQWDHHNWV